MAKKTKSYSQVTATDELEKLGTDGTSATDFVYQLLRIFAGYGDGQIRRTKEGPGNLAKDGRTTLIKNLVAYRPAGADTVTGDCAGIYDVVNAMREESKITKANPRLLEEIFNDPLLADVTAPRKRTTSSDRLIAGFQQILDFYEANGRLPEDIEAEKKLYHMWRGILASESKIERCRPFDELGILPQQTTEANEPQAEYCRELTEEEQLEAILNDPLLADIGEGDDTGLFDIPEYMRERLNARKEAEYVGRNKPCEDFDKLES